MHYHKQVDKDRAERNLRDPYFTELERWGNAVWNQKSLEPYLNDPSFAAERDLEVTQLSRDWQNIKELFITFFERYCDPRNKRILEKLIFNTHIVSNLFQVAGELKPIHPWAMNIVESLRINVEKKNIKLEETHIQSDLSGFSTYF